MKSKKPNILILTAQVPFSRGGAELLVEELKTNLKKANFRVDVIQLPFDGGSKKGILENISMWRALNLDKVNGEKVDLVIPTKFPSYMVKHPNKVLWLVHQFREIYDLYNSRFGKTDTSAEYETFRRMIYEADKVSINESKEIFTISENVGNRLNKYLGISSTPLVPPLPLGDLYRSSLETENYILYVGRICSIKRVDLMVKSMSTICGGLKLKIVGSYDEFRFESYIKNEIEKHHLWDKVQFLGRVNNEDLVDLYSKAFLVYYAPYDEDLGFVTLEALKSNVPVITTKDSGGPLQYITHGVNGLVVSPNEKSISDAVNKILEDKDFQKKLKKGASQEITTNTWEDIIEKVVVPYV